MSLSPYENLLIKLWETLADKGIGAFFRPWQIRRDGAAHADVRAREILLLAQAEVDASDVLNGRKRFLADGRLLQITDCATRRLPSFEDERREPSFDIQAFAVESTSRDTARSVQREINVSRSIHYAEDVLASDTQTPSDKQIDFDWLESWREFASKATKEDARRLWGQVLAGEVKSPGAFSLRTLDFLRGLSPDEVADISRLGSLFIENRVFVLSDNVLDRHGVTVDFLLEMQQLGLLSGVGANPPTSELKASAPDQFKILLRAHGKALGVAHSDPSAALRLPAYLFTKLGREVMQLGHFVADEEVLISTGKQIAKQGFQVHLGDWPDITTEKGKIANSRRIEA